MLLLRAFKLLIIFQNIIKILIAIDQLAMRSSVCWYGHVLSREVVSVMERFDFEVDGHSKNG